MADQEEEAKAKKEVRVFGRPELASKVAMFQRKAEDHDRKQKDNPFSERWDGSASSALSKDDPRYGHPEEGSKTEKRGQQAGQLISSEVRVLCENVHEFGTEQPDGTRAITFGELFQALAGSVSAAAEKRNENTKEEESYAYIERIREIKKRENGDELVYVFVIEAFYELR
ncbi:hypothetical protein HPB51_002848 [Rhipicephalus microplus]|uniref:Costars domain-containing protein n=1 Tax=Rhipicephalus microplus TaxID=6941 RepID=A0A9J6EXM6_RHIMP|nr:hypothetical protein HPB51_002848 [Rhipicephalus microplus]